MTDKGSVIRAQVCIIGAGAGGTGCTYRLIKNGIKTVVADKNPDFGGTAVFGGVDGWEPGVSLDGIHAEIQKRLYDMPLACHVTRVVSSMNLLDKNADADPRFNDYIERPWGFCMPMGDSYEDTLGRCTSIRGVDGPMRRFQFEPQCYIKALHDIFSPYSDCLTFLPCHSYVSCKKENGKIISVTLSDGNTEKEIYADYFVDCSGDIVLARDAGCGYSFGREGHDEYGEPSATQKSQSVNGVSYVFRVAKVADNRHIDALPDWVKNTDLGEWAKNDMKSCVSFTVQYPCGDISFNMLPTMQGTEYFSLSDKADTIGKARVYAYWHYLQTEKGLSGYTLKHICNAGIREGYRLKGKYVLKEQDLRRGVPDLQDFTTVAIADHAMDIHGENGMCRELEFPYKIPLECCMTKEFENLFVACRGASFTHIAASSARLSRTLLSMGEGVGEYISGLMN